MSGRAALARLIEAVTGRPVEVTPGPVPGEVVDGRAFFAATDDRSLGPAIRWARSTLADGPRADGYELHVVAPPGIASVLARRAELVTPLVELWTDHGASISTTRPEPHEPPPVLPDEHWALAGVLSEAGARPVDDHGVLVGEVAGLEVARVVDGDGGTGPRIDVGVGLADRELQQFLHGHLDDHDNLRRAIGAVVRHRRPGSGAHPLTRVARQRWIRSLLLDDPDLIGLDALEPVVPLRPKGSLLSTEPSAAAGPGVVVVCSVGVDLDLLPEAADYRAWVDPEARLIVVVPERDRRLATESMTGVVADLTVASIGDPWSAPAPR